MAKVVLINPSYAPTYGLASSVSNLVVPTLGLATIAATALQDGHKVEILDLSWRPYDFEYVRDQLLKSKPDIVGITATTPFMNQLRDISVLVKDISKNILVVGGGPHPSAMPEETLRESMLDAVFVGEADNTFADVCNGYPLSDVPGLFYRDNDEIISTDTRPYIKDINELPMPAWHLYNLDDYHKAPRLYVRRPPMTMVEFSRGCVFRCDFCASKITMSLGYRKKSPERCAEEVKHLHSLGFREFHLADDIFTSDQKWATQVCDAISDSGVDMAWTCSNGIRVESADDNLFRSMKRSGCYRVMFGFESGNDQILKSFGKGGRASVQQARIAVQKARSAGLDTFGYFLLGLSPDTEKTMDDTIEFSRSIPVDMMKFAITIAFPGTPMFNNYVDRGLIRSFDWDQYFWFTDKDLFVHDHLSYDTIRKYMKKAYRRSILFNPSFIIRRLIRGIKNGEFFMDAYYAIALFLNPIVGNEYKSKYYAPKRWPKWSIDTHSFKPANYQIVGKKQSQLN